VRCIPRIDPKERQSIATRVYCEEILHIKSTSAQWWIDFGSEESLTFCDTTTDPDPKSPSGPAGEPGAPNGGPTFKPSKPLPPVEVSTGDEIVPSATETASESILFPDGSFDSVYIALVLVSLCPRHACAEAREIKILVRRRCIVAD